MTSSAPELRRCTAAVVARVLEAMPLEPLRIVLHQPLTAGLVPVEWRRCMIWLLRLNGELVVHRAVLPGPLGAEEWERGCERDDWSLGPDSVVVCPLRLLRQRSRDQLMVALAAAEVEESEVVIPGPVVE